MIYDDYFWTELLFITLCHLTWRFAEIVNLPYLRWLKLKILRSFKCVRKLGV